MTIDIKTRDETIGVPSLEDLYLRYRNKLIHFFIARGLEQDVAEDLSQEAFFRFLRGNKTFDNEDHARNLLYRVAQNLLIDYFRKHNGSIRIRPVSQDDLGEEHTPYLAAQVASPEESLICDETSLDIRAAVSQLPPRYAQAIVLKEYEGLSYREIATQMGVSQKAVESLLHRARSQLKEDLAERGRKRGGWWSGILLGLRGFRCRAVLKPLRTIGRMASKCRGIYLGFGTAGAGKSLFNLLLVMVLLGSVVGTGVAAAVSCGGTPAAEYAAEEPRQPGAEAGGGKAKPAERLSGSFPAGDDEITAGSGDVQCASYVENVPDGDMPAESGGLLVKTGDAAREVIISAGAALDEILAGIGRFLCSLSDPLAGLLFYAGMPQQVIETIGSLASLEVCRDISSQLVGGAVDATYVLDEAAAALSGLPPGQSGGSTPEPILYGGEEEEGAEPQKQPAPEVDSGSTVSSEPSADLKDPGSDAPQADSGQVVEDVVEGAGNLLEGVTGAVESLLPF